MKQVAMLDFGKFKLVVKYHNRRKNPFEVCFRIRGYSGYVDSTLEEYANLESCLYYIRDYIGFTEDAQTAIRADTPDKLKALYGAENA